MIGVHDERLDEEAIEAIALADPAWQVVLVGPVREGDVDEARLRALPNVHLLGGKALAELPAYLKALDVALIPYKLNELSRNIFPLKLFEYLAGGVPVVSAALPELAPYADMVALAARPQDYPALVSRALADLAGPGAAAARDERTRLAADNTWDGRVEVISGLVEDMLERRGVSMRPMPRRSPRGARREDPAADHPRPGADRGHHHPSGHALPRARRDRPRGPGVLPGRGRAAARPRSGCGVAGRGAQPGPAEGGA